MAKKNAKTAEVQENVLETSTSGIVVDTDLLNIRKGPGVGNPVVCIIEKGTTVTNVEEVNDEWYKVETPKGNGYCMKTFVKLS